MLGSELTQLRVRQPNYRQFGADPARVPGSPLLTVPNQARVGQAISEMEGTCHQTWMAGLAPERDAIGTWAVDEIGTFGP